MQERFQQRGKDEDINTTSEERMIDMRDTHKLKLVEFFRDRMKTM